MGLTQGPDQKGDFAQKTKPHCIMKKYVNQYLVPRVVQVQCALVNNHRLVSYLLMKFKSKCLNVLQIIKYLCCHIEYFDLYIYIFTHL